MHQWHAIPQAMLNTNNLRQELKLNSGYLHVEFTSSFVIHKCIQAYQPYSQSNINLQNNKSETNLGINLKTHFSSPLISGTINSLHMSLCVHINTTLIG